MKAIEEVGISKKYPFDDIEYLLRQEESYLHNNKHYSREELIEHLIKLKLELGRVPRGQDLFNNYKKDITPSHKTYIKEFGTITNARKAANLIDTQWQKFSKAELVEQLKRLGEKLGRKPTGVDINLACSAGEASSIRVFVNKFGSLIKAYEAAGFEVPRPSLYSDQEIIKKLGKLRQKLGRRLSANDIKRASSEGSCPSLHTISRRIGGLSKVEELLNENTEIQSKIKCDFCNSERVSEKGFAGKYENRKLYYCQDCQELFCENIFYIREKNASTPRAKAPKIQTQKIKTQKTETPKLKILPAEEVLMEELQQIARELNKTPTIADINRLSREKRCHSRRTYYAVFGHFVNATKAAGLKRPCDREFDKEKLLFEITKIGRTFDRPVSARDVKEAARKKLISPLHHFLKTFDTLTAAIFESGINKKYSIDYDIDISKLKGYQLPKAKSYSREELIKYLRKLELKLGYIPRYSDIKRNYKKYVNPSLKAYEKEFGTISNARKAAHILNKRWQKFSKADLIEQLKKLGEKLGRKPFYSDIERASKAGEGASPRAFETKFGTVIKACEAAGFEILKPKEYSSQEIIKKLRKLRQKLGRKINQKDIREASLEGWCPCLNTVYKKLGGMEKIEEILTNG